MKSIKDRVRRLQSLLLEHSLDAYVVPSADPHQSEYVAEGWKRRQFISGFSGSSGLFACNRQSAGLWTDGRYFVQAEVELHESGIDLFRQGKAGVPDWKAWMVQTLKPGARLGINQHLFSMDAYAALEQQMKSAGIVLVPQEEDLVDRVWGDERPGMLRSPLREHPLEFAGQSAGEKLAKLRKFMSEQGAGALIVSALDEIAWLFNLRGADVAYNPVFYAFARITQDEARLFVHPDQLTPTIKQSAASFLQFSPYDAFLERLHELQGHAPVFLDPATTSAAVEQRLRQLSIPALVKTSPLAGWKAVKTEEELAGMRASHVRDGVAVFRLLLWLKSETAAGHTPSEMGVDEVLQKLRARAPNYRGPSFATIAAYGPHGALPHYRATPGDNSLLRGEGIFLLDSGGQYTDGTTDITRTVSMGSPTARERRVYTAVLRGHLLLGRSLFPRGVNGYQLDAIARQPLWSEQLEYNHGTGHGVGAALCVHEGPFSVSPRNNTIPLEVGHILSNEPGCYLEGHFGVRIENLVTVVKKSSADSLFGEFLGFEDLTLCPYDRTLIDVSLLSAEDKLQVDAYHRKVYEQLAPHLDPSETHALAAATAPLSP